MKSLFTMRNLFMLAFALCVGISANAGWLSHDQLLGLSAVSFIGTTEEFITKAVMEGALVKLNAEIKTWIDKANGEIAAGATRIETNTKAALEELSGKATELVDRLVALEQKSAKLPADNQQALSLGEQFVKQETFGAWQARKSGVLTMATKSVNSIVNATGLNQPLVRPQFVDGIMYEPPRPLRIRDILPIGITDSNLIEYTKENVFTDNAAPQYGSPNFEDVTKPQSTMTFSLFSTPVVTIGHFVVVSKQVLADAPQLQSYINTRLMYGLKLEEENELLNGDGTGGKLSGLLKAGNYTAYNRHVSGDTKIDTLRRAVTQVALSNYPCDGIVLHPTDWESIELTKNTLGSYIWTNPTALAGPSLWGQRIVVSQAITAGTFLAGAFSLGAQLWDRQQANITVSFENNDNFVKNMSTILAEERLALAVYRPKAFISGSL